MNRIIGILLAAIFMCACDSSQQGTSTNDGKKSAPSRDIRINLGGEPETLDPAVNQSLIGSTVMKGLFEGLVSLDGDARAIPAAAESWEHNDDYTEWTFHLRPDGKWSNGDPVTAGDFAYGVSRVLTPSVAAPYAQVVIGFLDGADDYYKAGGLDSGETVPSIVVLDNLTLRYDLANATPFFDTIVDLGVFFPANRKNIEEHGDAWWQNPKTYVGNGAFELESFRSKDRLIMTRSENYHSRDEIFWESVEFFFIESLPTEMRAFEAGDLDITSKVDLADVARWKDKPEWDFAPNFGTYYLSFQNEKAPFDDVRVRRAFSLAIDRERLVKRLNRGELISEGMIPESLMSPRGGTFRDAAGRLVPDRDVEKARALLAEAGYGEGGKEMPALEYVYDANDDHKIVAELLQSDWKEALGVDFRLQPVDWGTRLERGRTGNFFVIRNGWYGDYMDAMTFLEMWESGNQLNRARMKNAEYDRLINAARAETDAVKREDLMIAAEKILVEDEVAVAPLFTYALPRLVDTSIEGLVRNATGDLLYQRARRRSE